jgi:hypothetical protein
MWFENKKEQKLLQEIADLAKQLIEVTTKKDEYKDRCILLEDGIKKDFGITVRQEITEVKVAFTLMELTVLYTALCKLMERPLVTEDVQYYLSLRMKLEDLMNKVKE